jgi:lipoic acid synthetase
VRERSPETDIEVLISDLKGDPDDLQIIIDARPDVMNHNVETVARLQRAVRPSAGYLRSLTVLARSAKAGLVTKSGMMVGLGETKEEIEETLADLAAIGVQIATIGQYLRPTERHLPVSRYWEPAEFDDLAVRGKRLGLSHVQSSPLTRSSYHAREALGDATPLPTPTRR